MFCLDKCILDAVQLLAFLNKQVALPNTVYNFKKELFPLYRFVIHDSTFTQFPIFLIWKYLETQQYICIALCCAYISKWWYMKCILRSVRPLSCRMSGEICNMYVVSEVCGDGGGWWFPRAPVEIEKRNSLRRHLSLLALSKKPLKHPRTTFLTQT